MEWLKEFYEVNKEWFDRLIIGLVSAIISYLTARFQTRSSRIEDLIDGKNVYDDNDLIVIDRDYKRGEIMPLSHFSIVKKGKNSDEQKNPS